MQKFLAILLMRTVGSVSVLAGFLALALSAGPARASATNYDIAVLLYQTHPWIGSRLPEAAARRANAPAGVDRWNTVPPLVAPGAGPYTVAQMAGTGLGPQGNPTGPYSAFVYGGVASKHDLFAALAFDSADASLLAAGMSARLHRFSFGLEIEGEVGVARRFGDDTLWEVWTGVGLRWREFPWNDVIYTTVGLTLVGLSYTTEVPDHERRYHGNDDSRLLGFFAPEITLALPSHPEIALLLRLHHRTNVFRLFGDGSATFTTAGLRFAL